MMSVKNITHRQDGGFPSPLRRGDSAAERVEEVSVMFVALLFNDRQDLIAHHNFQNRLGT